MNPIVTIGMPVHNGERFIAETLDRLLDQTRDDFVIHVADNASSDRTAEIVTEYAQRDDRIVYHRHPENHGAAHNVNYLIRTCRTKYFKLAAHDDHHEPEYLERCLAPLEADDDVVLCHSLTSLIDADGNRCPTNRDGTEAYDHAGRAWPIDPIDRRFDSPRAHERFHDFIHDTILVGEIWGVIRHEALMQTRLFGRYFGSDRPMLAELALLGPFAIVPEELFSLRLHGTHATRQGWRERAARVDATAPVFMQRFSGLHTYMDFIRAAATAPIPVRERALALLSCARLPFRKRVLMKLLPGPFSYFGIERPSWWPRRKVESISPLALHEGERIDVGDGPMVVQGVEQRNWSRVATAVDADGSRVFIKQHLHGAGTIDLPRLEIEVEANRALSQVLDRARVPAILHVDRTRALVVHEWCRLEPPDELLRRDPAAFDDQWDGLLRGLPDVVLDLTKAAVTLELPAGPGHAATQPEPVEEMAVYDGFEMRNVALADGERDIVLFDTGPLRRVSVHMGCARLIASTALLNWGRPLGRMIAGPPVAQLRSIVRVLPTVPFEVARAELQRQASRHARSHRSGLAGRVEAASTAVLGRWYLLLATRALRAVYRDGSSTPSAMSHG